MRQRVELHKKQSEKLEAKRDAKHKAVKKQIYRVLGQVEKRKSKRRGGDDWGSRGRLGIVGAARRHKNDVKTKMYNREFSSVLNRVW